MVQQSSSSAATSFSIFSILSAIRFCTMINLIRGVLRGENEVVGINRIKNMRFPEIHIYSVLLLSMISSYEPKKLDSGKLKNPKCSTEGPNPSEKLNGKGINSAEDRLGSQNHPLKKLGSCKVGLGIILGSPFDNIVFGQQVKGNFPKHIRSSTEMITTTEVDAPNSSSFHKPFNFSPDNANSVVDMTNVSGEAVPVQSGRVSYNICHEWPCVFAQNQGFDSMERGSPFTNGSRQLTICTKHRNTGFLSLKDIENTDNYTRKTNYLPYLKVTHMYNDCILEFPECQIFNDNFNNKKPVYPPRVHNLRRWSVLSSNENFLKKCETCDKSLEGLDVYIYRGESSFCSVDCRYWKVKAKMDLEKVTRMVPMVSSSSNKKKPIFYVDAKPGAGA